MPSDKPITVRIPEQLLDHLTGLTIVDGRSLADVVRGGLEQYVAQRRSAPTFQEEVDRAARRQQDQLAALARR